MILRYDSAITVEVVNLEVLVLMNLNLDGPLAYFADQVLNESTSSGNWQKSQVVQPQFPHNRLKSSAAINLFCKSILIWKLKMVFFDMVDEH